MKTEREGGIPLWTLCVLRLRGTCEGAFWWAFCSAGANWDALDEADCLRRLSTYRPHVVFFNFYLKKHRPHVVLTPHALPGVFSRFRLIGLPKFSEICFHLQARKKPLNDTHTRYCTLIHPFSHKHNRFFPSRDAPDSRYFVTAAKSADEKFGFCIWVRWACNEAYRERTFSTSISGQDSSCTKVVAVRRILP